MSNASAFNNADIATQLLDLVQEIANAIDPMPVKFQELTASAGDLPRLMLSPINGESYDIQQYISGEQIYTFPCALRLRQSIRDEQTRLDARSYLANITKDLLVKCQVLDGYVVCRKPTATVPVCLGATNDFEDWEVTLSLIYKTTI